MIFNQILKNNYEQLHVWEATVSADSSTRVTFLKDDWFKNNKTNPNLQVYAECLEEVETPTIATTYCSYGNNGTAHAHSGSRQGYGNLIQWYAKTDGTLAASFNTGGQNIGITTYTSAGFMRITDTGQLQINASTSRLVKGGTWKIIAFIQGE